jgi:hypothetical protein
MTNPEVLFNLAIELAASHRRSEAGQVNVLPILVDDLVQSRVVLEALCDLTGGRFFGAGDDDLEMPVPATTSPLVAPAVEAALTTVPSGGTRRVVISKSGDRVDAAFIDPPAGPDPSTGERTVLAVARAAMHADLDSAQLAVIAWPDSGVDLRLRSALWRLGVDQLAAMQLPALRTLVMAVETEIDVNLHCQLGRGFRFAIQNGRFLRRHGKDALGSTVRQIVDHPDPFVLFLGAGFSVSSRLPLGNALRDQAIRRILNIDTASPVTSYGLAKRFSDWIFAKPGWLNTEEAATPVAAYIRQLTLEQVVRAEKRLFPSLPTLQDFRTHHDRVVGSPGIAALELAKLLRLAVGRVIIVEVNFDRLVESHAEAPIRVFASDDEFADAVGYVHQYLAGTETDIPVLKLHGTIDRPETCVISDDQTERGVGKNKLEVMRAILSETSPRLWIYVGTSMRDRDLIRVFSDEDWARGVEELWVSPYLDETVEEFATSRRPFWRDRRLVSIDDRLTSETADTFFTALREAFERK